MADTGPDPESDAATYGTPPITDSPPDAGWWRGGKTTALHLERLTRERDRALPIEVPLLLWLVARSVACLELTFPGGERADGTGFLIQPKLLLTNYHNVMDKKYGAAETIVANFDRRERFNGTPLVLHGTVYEGGLNAEDDWAVIQLECAADDRLPIALGTPHSLSLDDQIIIIGHPLGGYKRYAQDALSLQYIAGDVIQYLADTQKGSSGSPVFNARVHCIALHHAEAEVEVADGDRLRKIYRNEGIHIERVMAGLRAAGIPFDDEPLRLNARLLDQALRPGPPDRSAARRELEENALCIIEAMLAEAVRGGNRAQPIEDIKRRSGLSDEASAAADVWLRHEYRQYVVAVLGDHRVVTDKGRRWADEYR